MRQKVLAKSPHPKLFLSFFETVSLQEFAKSGVWTVALAAGVGLRQTCACLHVCGGFESWEGRNYTFDGEIQETEFCKGQRLGLSSGENLIRYRTVTSEKWSPSKMFPMEWAQNFGRREPVHNYQLLGGGGHFRGGAKNNASFRWCREMADVGL